MAKTLVEMAAEIIQAQASYSRMTTEEMAAALNKTFEALKAIKDKEEGLAEEVAEEKISPKESIQRNKVICLECGKEFKQITKAHLSGHGLTAKEYKQKYGIPMKQALAARNLSAKRRKVAKKLGLGERLAKARRQKG